MAGNEEALYEKIWKTLVVASVQINTRYEGWALAAVGQVAAVLRQLRWKEQGRS